MTCRLLLLTLCPRFWFSMFYTTSLFFDLNIDVCDPKSVYSVSHVLLNYALFESYHKFEKSHAQGYK